MAGVRAVAGWARVAYLLRRVGGGERGEPHHVRLQHRALREDLDEVELVAADGPEDGLGQRVGGEPVHARAYELLQLQSLAEQRRMPVVVAHLRDLLVRTEHAEEVEESDLDEVGPQHAQRVALPRGEAGVHEQREGHEAPAAAARHEKGHAWSGLGLGLLGLGLLGLGLLGLGLLGLGLGLLG